MEHRIKYFSLWFCLICVIVFLLQLIIPNFTYTFMLTEKAFIMPWQFITAIFLHGGIAHLLYNLFALFLFGIILEKIVGSKKFLWIYFLSGIFANLISIFWYPNALGASGAIMGVIGCLAVLRPGMIVWVYNLPMPMFIAAIVWAGASVLGIFGLGDQGTGHLAHLSGIVIGLIYGFYLKSTHKEPKLGVNQMTIDESDVRTWEDEYMKR